MGDRPLLECYRDYLGSLEDGQKRSIIAECISILESGFDSALVEKLRVRFPDIDRRVIYRTLREAGAYKDANIGPYVIAEEL